MVLIQVTLRIERDLYGEMKEILEKQDCPFKSESEFLRESVNIGMGVIRRRLEDDDAFAIT